MPQRCGFVDRRRGVGCESCDAEKAGPFLQVSCDRAEREEAVEEPPLRGASEVVGELSPWGVLGRVQESRKGRGRLQRGRGQRPSC